MHVVVAPDSYKGSLSAQEAANAMEEGIRRWSPIVRVTKLPLADGGEGTVDALIAATGGRKKAVQVTGPLGDKVTAHYGILGDGETAVVEVAASSGLTLVPVHRRDPTVASTFGMGELLKAALDAGARRFIVGLGGSATNDAGVGMVQALGGRFYDEAGQNLPPGGAALAKLDRIDLSGLDARLQSVTMTVACDVSNPLVGRDGASAVYGPQKGADARAVRLLDDALNRFASVVRRQFGIDVAPMPGAGAAGGLGAGFVALLGATLRPGIDIVLSAVRFDEIVAGADVVITGEGMLDAQTVSGKTPYGVLQAASRKNVPVIAIGGAVDTDAVPTLYEVGFHAVLSSTAAPMSVEMAMARARLSLAWATETAMRLYGMGASTI